ncbi:hypothetical protein ACFL4K_01335 [Candidatus Neomarinimicrobiota bacterium]
MVKPEIYTQRMLTIEVAEGDHTINAVWRGKSIDREPGKFIMPILTRMVKTSISKNKRVTLDFREIDYMNSSTITPIIKILERAKRGSTQITVFYDKSLKWQDLIFSALTIFTTKDHRVEIQG